MSRLSPFNRKDENSITSNLMTPFNMIDDFIGETVSNFPNVGNLTNVGKAVFPETFKVDVSETSNEYIVEAELPDVNREEIDLYLNEGNLTISVEREETDEERNKDKTYLHKERRYSSMERSLYLVDAVDETAEVNAKLEKGLLEIRVPKDKEHTQIDPSKKITIE